MSHVISLALLVLATASALSAFGGETWKKGDDPILKRITRRGWFSLSFMVVMLVLGITKEVLSAQASGAAALAQLALQARLKETSEENAQLQAKLDSTQAELTKEIRARTSGVTQPVARFSIAVDGTRRQIIENFFGRHFRRGDVLHYKNACPTRQRPSSPGEFKEFTLPREPSELELEVDGDSHSLGKRGKIEIMRWARSGSVSVVLQNNAGVSGCTVELIAMSDDPFRAEAESDTTWGFRWAPDAQEK